MPIRYAHWVSLRETDVSTWEKLLSETRPTSVNVHFNHAEVYSGLDLVFLGT